MIFIHHHSDTEREEKPPQRIRHMAKRLCEKGGPVIANERGFVSATNTDIDDVRTRPAWSWADYWEIVIEDTDL